jgi:23S rRNA (uracil1939-C5)-methyltransferase
MKQQKTLEKNQTILLDVTGFTSEGGGVGHFEGMAVFVPGAAKGDRVQCLIIKAKKNYAVGKIVKIVKPAKIRTTPDCRVFPRCGGCVFRHIRYSAELELKWQRVQDAFSRLGHIDIQPQPIVGADTIDRYRNKAQYPVREEGGAVSIGFFAERSHRVIDCHDCRLQPVEFETILDIFEEWIKQERIPVYDEAARKGLLRHIYIRKAFATGEIMVCAVINGRSLPAREALIQKLASALPAIKSIAVNYNTEDTNVILGNRYEILWGSEFIEDVLCGVRVRLSPLSFYQVNREQAEKLYQKAADYAGLTGEETLLDLYCGAGTIGLSMAHRAKRLIGVEIVPEAVKDAKENAALGGIQNAEFLCADAAEAALTLQKRGINANVVILDPPRKGCSPELLETVAQIAPTRIVYVSCDPATLARDCALLLEKGYKVTEVTPVDLFPRTAHVECVVLMSRMKE